MISTGSVERLTEAVARAQVHWSSRPKEEAARLQRYYVTAPTPRHQARWATSRYR